MKIWSLETCLKWTFYLKSSIVFLPFFTRVFGVRVWDWELTLCMVFQLYFSRASCRNSHDIILWDLDHGPLITNFFTFTPWWVKPGSICWVFLVFSAVLNEFADWVSAYLTLPWWVFLETFQCHVEWERYSFHSTFPQASRLHLGLFRFSSSSHLLCHICAHPPPGWNKASLSADASEENDGYSSGEEPMNSDPEDEVGKKLVSLNLGDFA